MDNTSSEEPLDDKQWGDACLCAETRIRSDIARNYGLRLIFEDLCLRLEEGIPDDVLAQALKHIKKSFDVEAEHKECQEFLSKKRKEAEHLSARTARLPSSHSRAWKRDDSRHVLGHHRYQLPVGQGGFHVGTLRNLGVDETVWRSSLVEDAIPLADFMYVYDCGSIPIEGVVKAVRSIVSRRVSRRLDMLLVSHFDRDHICGIPHLLHQKKGLQVDTIVIPYLDDIERIIAFGRSSATSAEPRAERFHEDIVVDPIGTMTQFGPRQIVMVASDEEDDTDSGFFEFPPTEPPRSDPDGQPWKIKGSGGPRSAPPSARRTPEGAILVHKIEFNIVDEIKGGWLLKPHVKKAPLQDREAFCTAVEVMLKWPRGSFRKKAQSKKVRRSLVTKHRTILSRAYAWAFGDKNETSMSLYSGPANPEEAGAVVYKSKKFDCARVGWLGTGDACFLDPQTVRKYQDHYSEELEWVTTFMLPHHGSAHNFDPDLPVVDAELWVAAAQPKNSSWKHPAPGIVKAIKASGAKFRKVGSSPNSLLLERMVVFWPG
ncbi:hypothetical protein SAMN04488527_11049 [Aliiroseovarius crassostreae]|uniref:Metallo-beta-lactamase domain-containing protein n=1 Tax=Aliiroseovarius crassostreae TaxID=154981 RepID=A0A0P7JP74_9RHOB|nr:hypothetical protein [Aliiroseovarius crassostreae]KPN63045.1 hypothetical protein AKJ29_02540 [Aliiroseovarius crassostreae]SFU67345.1 hypothetical protein SAMN04488527_11049 [Aliiroseovarius crassostreae]